jgi:hypothetical protein
MEGTMASDLDRTIGGLGSLSVDECLRVVEAV